jgi:hypothetical protein
MGGARAKGAASKKAAKQPDDEGDDEAAPDQADEPTDDRDPAVSEAAEVLYGGPLASFVAERKRLASEVRKRGDSGSAAAIAALGKPSVSAWVVNRLQRDDPDQLAELFAAGQRMRGGDVSASRDQRAVLARLHQRAVAILEAGGHGTSPAMLRRVTTTLQALSAIGSFDPDPPGQLVEDRDPPGFDLLAGVPMTPRERDEEPAPRAKPSVRAAPPAAPAPPIDLEERRRRQRAAAQVKLLEQKATQAARRVDARADTASEIRADLERAEATAERLRGALAEADEALAEARAAAEEIARALADAAAQADPDATANDQDD